MCWFTVNSQALNPLATPVAPYGPLPPPVAASYSSEQSEAEEPQPDHNDDIAPPTPPSQDKSAADEQHEIQTVKPPPKQLSAPAPPDRVPAFSKPKGNPPKEISKGPGDQSPPNAQAAPAQKPANPVPLLKQSAPLTASSSPGHNQLSIAAAKFFNSLRTKPNSPVSVAPPPLPKFPPGLMKPPAQITQPFKPAVMASQTTAPQTFNPGMLHGASPQPFKPAVSFAESPQSLSPAPLQPLGNPLDTSSDDEENANGMQSAIHEPLPAEKPHADYPAAFSSEQPLQGQYPSNAYFPWNAQAPRYNAQAPRYNAPMYAWNPNVYYPQYPAAYTLPVSPPGKKRDVFTRYFSPVCIFCCFCLSLILGTLFWNLARSITSFSR